MVLFKSFSILLMPEKRPTFDITTFWMSMTAMKNHWSKYFKLLLSRKIYKLNRTNFQESE